jgi:hypothetical protein
MTSTATRPGAPGGPRPPAGPGPQPPAAGNEPPGGRERTGIAGLLDLPATAVRGIIRSSATTPGRLSVIAVGLVLLILVTGVVATVSVQGKKNTINDLIDQREPLAAAAQQVYRSLSDADATSASAFLSTGTEPPALRQRYEQDVAEAGAALAKSASDSAGVANAAAQVNILSQQVPVYTGLVETARANNRQGFPAGASYLREASELMRVKILPAAQDLYRIDTDRLSAEQDEANGFPWWTLLLVLLSLAALVVTQVYLTRKTNRVLNVGLVVATGAVVLGLLWSSVGLIVQSVLVDSGQSSGSHQVDVLVRTRIAALQARADETLTLVARGDGATYEQDFQGLAAQLVGKDGKSGLLGEAQGLAAGGGPSQQVDAAIRDADAWLTAHTQVRLLDDGGEYQAAVDNAVDATKPDGAAGAFGRLDGNLVSAITVGRQGFLDETRGADRALTALAPGLAVLAVVAAAGATIGIRERLREYR